MSSRNYETTLTVPREEIKAHAHSERTRIRQELAVLAQQVSAGVEADLLHEPGVAWKQERRHEYREETHEDRKRNRRHWKTRGWKRRSEKRRKRTEALQATRDAA